MFSFLSETYWFMMKNILLVKKKKKEQLKFFPKAALQILASHKSAKSSIYLFISFNLLPKQAIYCLLFYSSVFQAVLVPPSLYFHTYWLISTKSDRTVKILG